MRAASSTHLRVLRRAVLAATVAALAIGAGTSPVAAALKTPVPVKPFVTAPEVPARYVGQVSCEPSTKAGTLAFRQVLVDTYGPSTIGTLRACSSGGRSEHKDGRALDWMLNAANATDKAKASAFLSWLVGPDADGVAGGNAHRLGVMYVIWNKQTWQSWRGSWSAYTGANPHTDHIHISLSWDGAMKRTSWWTGTATTRYDYGPCQRYIGELAPPYSGPRYTPCPPPVPRQAMAFPRLWDADSKADLLARTTSGALNLYPGTERGTLSTARRIGTGWGGFLDVLQTGDFDKDGKRDVIARDAQLRLWLYRGNGTGGWLPRVQVASAWGGLDSLVGVGDMDRDGKADVLARRTSDGAARFYGGNGKNGFRSGRVVGDLKGQKLITAVGDWDGDAKVDLISVDAATGRLLLHSGTGDGGLKAPRQIGTGWGGFIGLAGTGDFTGDGRPDLVAQAKDGRMRVYRGNGTGGFLGSAVFSSGWTTPDLVG